METVKQHQCSPFTNINIEVRSVFPLSIRRLIKIMIFSGRQRACMVRSFTFATYRLFLVVLLTAAAIPVSAYEENILLLRGENDFFDEVVMGIKDELDGEIKIHVHSVNTTSDKKEFLKLVQAHRPKAVLLIGNKAANKYIKIEEKLRAANRPPTLVVAALFAGNIVLSLDKGMAILFEVPVVTSALTMRKFFKSPINTIGVIHRQWASSWIKSNRDFLQAEGIELVSHVVSNKSKNIEKEIKSGIKEFEKRKIGAVWIVNDNVLLNSSTLGKVWLPKLDKAKIPILVGVEALANTDLNFGNIAVSPSPRDLGIQAGSVVFDLWDNDWQPLNNRILQPISVKKVINLTILKNRSIPYEQRYLTVFDKVINE